MLRHPLYDNRRGYTKQPYSYAASFPNDIRPKLGQIGIGLVYVAAQDGKAHVGNAGPEHFRAEPELPVTGSHGIDAQSFQRRDNRGPLRPLRYTGAVNFVAAVHQQATIFVVSPYLLDQSSETRKTASFPIDRAPILPEVLPVEIHLGVRIVELDKR
jgi:hypothetical protein